MFRTVRRSVLQWPSRLLMAVVACALVLGSAPNILVHSHADAAGHHHHQASDEITPADDQAAPDPATLHVHDTSGVGAAVAYASPTTSSSPLTGASIADPLIRSSPAVPPDFLHRPPIA